MSTRILAPLFLAFALLFQASSAMAGPADQGPLQQFAVSVTPEEALQKIAEYELLLADVTRRIAEIEGLSRTQQRRLRREYRSLLKQKANYEQELEKYRSYLDAPVQEPIANDPPAEDPVSADPVPQEPSVIDETQQKIGEYEQLLADVNKRLAEIESLSLRKQRRLRKEYASLLEQKAYYEQELEKYKASQPPAVYETHRETLVEQRVETTVSEPVLIDERVEEVVERTDSVERVIRITTKIWRTTTTERVYEISTVIAYYSDGTSEVVGTTEALVSEVETHEDREDVTREVISETPIASVPDINWQTDEYLTNYGLSMIGADAAYQQGWTGEGVTVAVIDSGVDLDHADLDVTSGYNFVDYNTNADDDNGHGTHVAGIIAAKKNDLGTHGVAFDAQIMPIKVLDASGSGSFLAVGDGVTYAADQGVKVANLSLGADIGYAREAGQEYIFDYYFSAFQYAVSQGTTMVVAAGNSGLSCADGAEVYCSFPAALPYVDGFEGLLTGLGGFISVGAVDATGELAYYSNQAGIMKDWYLVAPGSAIVSTYHNGGYAMMSGTSMAAPHVAGAFALLAQKFPYLSGNEITQILFETATDLGLPGVDDIYGHGLLNVERSMQPVGELSIPLGNTVEGVKTDISGSYLTASPAFAGALKNAAVLQNALTLDKYNRAYTVDMTKLIGMTESAFDFDAFQMMALDDLKFGIAGTEGGEMVLGYQMTDRTHVLFGFENSVFGSDSSGALSLGDGKTFYARLGYEDSHEQFTYGVNLDYGVSSGHSVSSGMIKGVSTLHGVGLGVWAKTSLDESNHLSFSLKSPISVMSGRANIEVADVRHLDGSISYQRSSVDLAPSHREINLGVSWLHDISDRSKVNVGWNAIWNEDNVASGLNNQVNVKYELRF